jgi:ribosome maturation factor RimP
MSTTQIDRLRELLGPLAAKRGLDLEEIVITPAGKRRVLRVVVDTDEGVGLEACAELSRAASQVLDESEAMGGAPYVLEVSSPGAERPLTAPRHYRRATGRLIRAQLREGGELTARITGADEEGVDVEVPGQKGRKPTARRVAFADIARARVEVEFSRKTTTTEPGPRAAIPDESQKEA